MQLLTTAFRENTNNELQRIVIKRSPRGRKLKKPITIPLPEHSSPGEKAVQQYVINAFCSKMAALIPFTLKNKTVLRLATYLYRYTTGSRDTLYQYVYSAYRFFTWLDDNPDIVLEACRTTDEVRCATDARIDEFIGELKAQGLAAGTISNYVKGVKALFRVNGLPITLPYRISRRVTYHDRAPTPEDLTKILDLATIRGKVIISLLALSGIRIGTLVKLQYRHIKQDYERGMAPIHIHIESEITKGKYHDYDTFIGPEAATYLRAYLDARANGTYYLRSEQIDDTSPLIRDAHANMVRPVSPACIHQVIHRLYVQAKLISTQHRRRYQLRPHSLRKYFRTQLGSLGTIPTDYIEYMMGHTISTYNDIKMKSIDFLRNLYAQSGLSIRPKTQVSKIQQLKLILEAWDMNPHEILSKKALTIPYRTIIDPEQEQLDILNHALKQAILLELKHT
jgi:integrase